MFCPRCAAQNLDDAKFCRVCGTNLESVALGLVDNYHLAEREPDRVQDSLERWLEARKKGVNKIATGIGMLVSSILIGIALWLFSGKQDWIIIWTVLVGWMTCLGIISMVLGMAGLMETRFLRRQLGQSSATGNQLVQPLPPGDRILVNAASTAPIVHPQSSVTEHTTTRLIKPKPPSNQAN
jgi:membrane protein YqaA with SNARE-associated domain